MIFREEETERTTKLDTWRKIKEKSSTAIADSRSRLDEIKSKDSRTTPEIQEQLEEIKVNKLAKPVKVNSVSLIMSLFSRSTNRPLAHSVIWLFVWAAFLPTRSLTDSP